MTGHTHTCLIPHTCTACVTACLCEPCESGWLVPSENRRRGGVSAEIKVMDCCQLSLGCCEDGGIVTHQRQRHARQEFLIENWTQLKWVETGYSILVFSELCLKNILLIQKKKTICFQMSRCPLRGMNGWQKRKEDKRVLVFQKSAGTKFPLIWCTGE